MPRPASAPVPALMLALMLALTMAVVLPSRAAAQGEEITDLLAPEGASAAPQGAGAGAGAGPGSIDARSSPAQDADIRRRLLGIYGELDALGAVEPAVANGIVTLGGTAGSARAAERAIRIASQVKGVVDVVDEMSVDANVARRLAGTFERLRGSALAAVAALPVFALALGVVALFWWLARWLARRGGVFAALAPNGFIAELLAGVARIVVVLLGLFLALSLLDATSIIGTVLGAAGIVGLAVGFAVRDTVENWIASVLLSLRTPFLARDYVRIGEHEGAVARLTSRATVLVSLDGNHIRIPNATVYKSVIVNYTRDPARRFEFTVGVDTELDLNEAQQTALDAVHEVPGVLATPPAAALVEALGDSSVTLTVMAWMDQRESDVRKVRSECIRFVKQAFDAAGIVMPEPIYRVNVNMLAGGGAEPLETAADPGDAPDPQRGSADGASAVGPRAPAGPASTAPASAPVPTPAMAPLARPRARDARDTSLDTGAAATLDREIGAAGGSNLLDTDAPCE